MADTVQEGDKVSWKWGAASPSGTVSEVKPGEVTVTSHKGNDISKTGDESDPAVHIERSGNDVVKKASELTVNEPAEGAKDDEKAGEEEEKPAENGAEKEDEEEAQTGDKRKADEKADASKDKEEDEEDEAEEEEKEPKKQKTATTNGAANGTKKGPGRPKGIANGDKKTGAKKEKKVPAVGRAQRTTRSQTKA